MTINYDELADRLKAQGIYMTPEGRLRVGSNEIVKEYEKRKLTHLEQLEQATTEQKEAQQMEEQKRETEEFWNRKAAELTPTTLQQAQRALKDSEGYDELSEEKDGNAYWRSRCESEQNRAATLAAIASAEALTDIAEILGTILGTMLENDLVRMERKR